MFKRKRNLGVSTTQFYFKVNRLFKEQFSDPMVICHDTLKMIKSGFTDLLKTESSFNIGLPKEVAVGLAVFTPSRSWRKIWVARVSQPTLLKR